MAVSKSDREVENAATKAAKELGYEAMKPEQVQIVTGALHGRDVFRVLPTGFGKSLCFVCLPSALDHAAVPNERAVHCAGCYSIDSDHERSGDRVYSVETKVSRLRQTRCQVVYYRFWQRKLYFYMYMYMYM